MKLTIIDKNNLPKFKLLLTFEEHDNKEAIIASLNAEHVKELITRQSFIGELGIPDNANADRYLMIDTRKASHAIESILETVEGVEIECMVLKNGRTGQVYALLEQGIAHFAPRMLMTPDKSKYYFVSIDLTILPSGWTVKSGGQ